MGPFEYFEPSTIEEAVLLLNKYGNEAKVLAGGTALVNMMKKGVIKPGYIVNIGCIPDLDYIRIDGDKDAIIKALTTIRRIEQSQQLQPKYGMICEAAGQLASVSVRNVATIGGGLCNAAPGQVIAPTLIALSAKVKLVSVAGERIVRLENFFIGSGATVLKTSELLIDIQIPTPPAHSGGAYVKYSRGGEDYPIVGVAALITLDSGNKACTGAKVVLDAVAPTPMIAHKSEEILEGEELDDKLIEKAAQVASDESSPIDDVRCSAEYKRKMVRVIARDAIKRAAERAKSAV